MASLFAPQLRSRRFLPVRQAVGSEIDQIRTSTPAIQPADLVSAHVQPADPRDVQLRVVGGQAKQFAEQHISPGKFKAILPGRLWQRRRNGIMHRADAVAGELKRPREKCGLPAQDARLCRAFQLTRHETAIHEMQCRGVIGIRHRGNKKSQEPNPKNQTMTNYE